MHKFATSCEAIAGTTKKLQKTAIVGDYLKSCNTDEAAVSAVFLSGRPFPVWEEATLQIGGRSLWQILADLSGKGSEDLTAAYRRRGDLGAVAEEVLPQRTGQGLSVLEVEHEFRQIAAARGPSSKATIVRELLSRSTPLEAKYIVKIMTGDLADRIEGESGRGGNCQGLRQYSARSSKGQYVARRHRRCLAPGD